MLKYYILKEQTGNVKQKYIYEINSVRLFKTFILFLLLQLKHSLRKIT